MKIQLYNWIRRQFLESHSSRHKHFVICKYKIGRLMAIIIKIDRYLTLINNLQLHNRCVWFIHKKYSINVKLSAYLIKNLDSNCNFCLNSTILFESSCICHRNMTVLFWSCHSIGFIIPNCLSLIPWHCYEAITQLSALFMLCQKISGLINHQKDKSKKNIGQNFGNRFIFPLHKF